MRAAAAGVIAALLAAGARADQFPTRQGTSGLLDVADANALERGAIAIGLELRLDRAPGKSPALGPSPLSVGFGLGRGLEAGLALREGGLPGDPRPSPPLFTGALKLRLFDQAGARPAVGVQLGVDRVNLSARGSLDLLATADLGRRVRASALVGVEQLDGLGARAVGPRAGVAFALKGPASADVVLEALRVPGGSVLGGALRWAVNGGTGFAIGAQWQPGDHGLRISLGFAFASAQPHRARAVVEEEVKLDATAKPAATAPGARVFRDPVPRLRLKVKQQRMPGEDGNRHLQFGPREAGSGATPPAPAPIKTPERSKPDASKRSPPVVLAVHIIPPAQAPKKPEPPRLQARPAVKVASVEVASGMSRVSDCLSSAGWVGRRHSVVLLLDSKDVWLRAAFVEGWRRELWPLQSCVQSALAGSKFSPADGVRTILLQLPQKAKR